VIPSALAWPQVFFWQWRSPLIYGRRLGFGGFAGALGEPHTAHELSFDSRESLCPMSNVGLRSF
jgi:hypothetical protein